VILRLAKRLLLAVLLLSPMTPVPSAAVAQSAEPLTIAVLDLERILRDAQAAKSLRGEIEASRSAFQTELRKQETDLAEADQKLARQRAVLSAEAFAEKRKELEQRAAKLQRDFVSRQRELERSFAQGLAEVRRALIEVSKEIAVEQNIDIILHKASLILAIRELDITGEALKRLDEKLPAVSLSSGQN
jgi:Skp family chaperone for outer membrane proteins